MPQLLITWNRTQAMFKKHKFVILSLIGLILIPLVISIVSSSRKSFYFINNLSTYYVPKERLIPYELSWQLGGYSATDSIALYFPRIAVGHNDDLYVLDVGIL